MFDREYRALQKGSLKFLSFFLLLEKIPLHLLSNIIADAVP